MNFIISIALFLSPVTSEPPVPKSLVVLPDKAYMRMWVAVPQSGSGQLIRVYDRKGKLVAEEAMKGNTLVDISHLEQGYYRVQVSDLSRTWDSRVIIVR